MIQTAQRSRFGSSPGRRSSSAGGPSTFGEFCPVDSWSPPINIYRLTERIDICVDLAGVKKELIHVHIEPGRLTIGGERQAPQPRTGASTPALRILMMEISHGPFCRTLSLPENIDIDAAESHYEDGLLWVRIPLLRTSAGRKR